MPLIMLCGMVPKATKKIVVRRPAGGKFSGIERHQLLGRILKFIQLKPRKLAFKRSGHTLISID